MICKACNTDHDVSDSCAPRQVKRSLPKLGELVEVQVWSTTKGLHWLTARVLAKEFRKDCGPRLQVIREPYDNTGERVFWTDPSSIRRLNET